MVKTCRTEGPCSHAECDCGFYDKEMQAALAADGEKLLAMTGEDHGPWDIANDGPFYHIEIPVTVDGNGPADASENASIDHEVWDQLCRTLCRCTTAEDARLIADAVNAFRR